MCRKYIRLLALMIVLTMSLSSCKLLFNIDEVRETNHMKNYYGTINGGVFYTDIGFWLDDDLRDAYDERLKAVDALDEEVTLLFNSDRDLYQVLTELEETCVKALEQMVANDVALELEPLNTNLLEYKRQIQVLMDSGETLDEMESTDKRIMATIQNKKFLDVADLSDTIDEYAFYLIELGEDTRLLVEEFDLDYLPTYVEELEQGKALLYQELLNYMKAKSDLAIMYTYINSGDYHLARCSMLEMGQLLTTMESSSDESFLEAQRAYDYLLTNFSEPKVFRIAEEEDDMSLLPSVFIHALAASDDEETEEERNAREFVEGANKLKEEEGKNAGLLFYIASRFTYYVDKKEYGDDVSAKDMNELILLMILSAKVNQNNGSENAANLKPGSTKPGNKATSAVNNRSQVPEDVKRSLEEYEQWLEYSKYQEDLIDKATEGLGNMDGIYEDGIPKSSVQMVNSLLLTLESTGGGLDMDELDQVKMEMTSNYLEILGQSTSEVTVNTGDSKNDDNEEVDNGQDNANTGDSNTGNTSGNVTTSLSDAQLLKGQITSDYQVGRDNFQIPNIQTFYAPNGISQGTVEGNLYYHIILKYLYGNLYERYGGSDPVTKGFWQDDADLIRFCSHLQSILEGDNKRLDQWMISQVMKSQDEQWLMTLRSMNAAKFPQYVILAEKEDSYTKGEETHAVIAYRSDGNRLYIMDPNDQNNSNNYLEMNLNNFKMKSYNGYKYMFFVDATALYDFGKIGKMIDELETGEYGRDMIPEYTLYQVVIDSDGNETKVPLNKIHDISGDEIIIQLDSGVFNARLSVFDTDGAEKFYSRPQDNRVMIPLDDKSERIGLLIDEMMPGALGYVDFQWITINRSEMEKWHVAMKVIENYHPEKYSDAEQAAMMEVIQEVYLYLQLQKDQKLALMKMEGDDTVYQFDFDGSRMTGSFEEVHDGVTYYERFDITFEKDDYGTGYILVGDSKEGDGLMFDSIWSLVGE